MRTKSITRAARRLSALVAGVALAALALPAAAHDVAPGNIDADRPVSLTIHKYEQPGTGTLGNNNGALIEDVPADARALAGVEFTVWPVKNIDLLTVAGWDTAEDLTAAEVMADAGAYPLGAPVSGVTGADGALTFDGSDGLGIGLYLVRETHPGSNPIVQPAVPFLVGLPQPEGDGSWNYDVHVYPKNALSDVTKGVDDSAAVVIGDVVDWTVRSAVPVLPESTRYTDYVIQDVLDSRLGFDSISVALEGAGTLTGSDYAVSAPAKGANGEVTVEFTEAGLGKLDSAGPGAAVVVNLSTVVLALGDGVIPNTATVFINDPSRSNGHESNQVQTKWGALRIVKHAQGDQAATLEGAEFDVYAVDPSTSGAAPVASIRSGADGAASIELQTGQAHTRDYWLVETRAPAGYLVDATPIPVTVTAGALTDATVVTIANEQVPAFALPATGGIGTLAFTVLGLGLVLVGAGAYAAARRQRLAAPAV
ncbi:SpaH/EbpB family LPXTG-anchored major pilin [Sediminivirga luteola]|uniref:SpaH/EbpB family LPXTG-anchored major pilin n=1 Tax=Sediminivirga luteola TaxID=1774748 RepID=UPI001F5946BE|nr:SpaH/EbpB family LPXTG-anchored major pilin [Sediminivirga luteola]MCI2264518.1 SpaH/EbpB family LPXTG-anchored major pilin [Sediminivirga luteola]